MKAIKPTPQRWQRTPIRNEATWIPRDLDDLEQLRSRLAAAGHTNAVIAGITAWLVGKALGEHDHTAKTTRAQYRKILADLGAGLYPEDDPRARREAGDFDHRGALVAAGMATAGAVAVGAAPAAVAFAAVTLPIILGEPVMSDRPEGRVALAATHGPSAPGRESRPPEVHEEASPEDGAVSLPGVVVRLQVEPDRRAISDLDGHGDVHEVILPAVA